MDLEFGPEYDDFKKEVQEFIFMEMYQMLKRTLTLIATVVVAANSYANPGHQVDNKIETIECYASATGTDGLASTNSAIIPPFTPQGTGSLIFMLTNIGASDINVSLTLYDENGVAYVPASGWTYDAKFSSTNTPKPGGTAVLSTNEIGVVGFDNNASTYLSGVLTWQADSCLTEAPLSAQVRYTNSWTSSHANSAVVLNGGNPF